VLALLLSAAVFTQADLRTVRPAQLVERQDPHIANEVADGRRLLSSADHCSLNGIPSLRQLLRTYEGRPEPELRLLAAEARYRAGDTLHFRQHDQQAKHWFDSVVRLYGGEPDIRFRRIVARSNYMLGFTDRNDAQRERHLQRVLSAYRDTNALELLQTYAKSLFALSDIRRSSGRNAEADLLAKQAHNLYHDRIIPRLPPPDPNPIICV
jgi:hypothetical protein